MDNSKQDLAQTRLGIIKATKKLNELGKPLTEEKVEAMRTLLTLLELENEMLNRMIREQLI